MLLPYGGLALKAVSAIVLAFALALNSIGNLLGFGDLVGTDTAPAYTLEAVAETQTVPLENEYVLYLRSSFRKVFNKYFNAFGIKNAISATDVELNKNKVSLPAGASAWLDADILPSNARNTKVHFVSDNPIIATVNAYGTVNALKQGEATVYAIAEDGGFYEKCIVTVTRGDILCDSVVLSSAGIILEKDSSKEFEYSIFPYNTTDSTSVSVSDLSKIGVSLANGILTVTAKEAGTSIVTVKCGDAFDTLRVTVTEPSGETPDENSTPTFGGSTTSNIGTVIRDMEALPDGGYVACGTTASVNGDFEHLYSSSLAWLSPFSFVAKFTDSGMIEWIELVGDSSAYITLNGISVLSNGNIVTAGVFDYPSTYSQDGSIDAAVLTLSPNGVRLSDNIFKGTGDDFFNSISATADGYVVGGKTNSTNGAFEGNSGMSTVIMSYDLNNNLLWKQFINASKSSHVADIDVDSNNNIFVSCITTATDGGFAAFDGLIGSYADTVVLKYSGSGNLLWYHTIASSGTDTFDSISADEEGGCYVAGNYTLVSAVSPDGTLSGIHNCGGTDALIFRIDENGNRLWHKVLAGFYNDFITDIIRTDNGIGVTGYTSSSNREFSAIGNKGGTDGFACFYDADGNGIGITAQAGSKDDAALCIAYSAISGEYFVAGRTKSSDENFAGNTFGNSSVGYTRRIKIAET